MKSAAFSWRGVWRLDGNLSSAADLPFNTAMLVGSFLAYLALAVIVSITDWRRGVYLLVLTGVIQDPVRKLTPGTPFWLMLGVIVVYGAILLATQSRLQRSLADFSRRFPSVWAGLGLAVFFIVLAAVNGLVTNGIGLWRVPLLSLFIYLAPLPAILLGYLYTDHEEAFLRFVTFYSVVTSVALIGCVFEYLRFPWHSLGMVAQVGDYLRYMPGIEVRMISGFYRAPDIMAWHASTLTCIAIAMAVRAGVSRAAWVWSLAAGWGFFNSMISGRRKAIYFVAVFAAVFVWRYFRRLKTQQVVAFGIAGLAMIFVVHQLASHKESSPYAQATQTTQEELAQRLEGGLLETIRQFGVLGAGLGVATQGGYHFAQDAPSTVVFGWQEGGLGKLAVELGVPGLLTFALLGWRMLVALNRIARYPDVLGTTQLVRVMCFGLVIANVANFVASAQAYSDPVLILLSAFFTGCLFGSAKLDEQPAPAPAPEPQRAALAIVAS